MNQLINFSSTSKVKIEFDDLRLNGYIYGRIVNPITNNIQSNWVGTFFNLSFPQSIRRFRFSDLMFN